MSGADSQAAERGLAIMVWSCDLTRPELLATPFMAAQAAAALDMQVKMLFSNQSVQWLLREHAGRLTGFGPDLWPIARHLDASVDLGIDIRACTQALQASGAGRAALAPQCCGVEGMVSFIEQGSAPGWRMLVF
jgi:predicted peroxiredoxin